MATCSIEACALPSVDLTGLCEKHRSRIRDAWANSVREDEAAFTATVIGSEIKACGAKPFTRYEIIVTHKKSSQSWKIHRRYGHFKAFHAPDVKAHMEVRRIILPSKSLGMGISMFTVSDRTVKLQRYLEQLCFIPGIIDCVHFVSFLEIGLSTRGASAYVRRFSDFNVLFEGDLEIEVVSKRGMARFASLWKRRHAILRRNPEGSSGELPELIIYRDSEADPNQPEEIITLEGGASLDADSGSTVFSIRFYSISSCLYNSEHSNAGPGFSPMSCRDSIIRSSAGCGSTGSESSSVGSLCENALVDSERRFFKAATPEQANLFIAHINSFFGVSVGSIGGPIAPPGQGLLD